jgi:starvation-inducible DNA-binding protein
MDYDHNNGHNPRLLGLIQPNIGLDNDVRRPVVVILNNTLANEAVLTQKTRNAHWNISGPSFFELHILFDTQYKQLNDISDKIAERVRMLGSLAIGTFEEFLSHTLLKEQTKTIPGFLHLLADHETIIRVIREDAKKCTEEFEDEGTSNLLISLMSLHEKMAWMLRSYIESDPILEDKQNED